MNNTKSIKFIGGLSALMVISYGLSKIRTRYHFNNLNRIKDQCEINLLEELHKTKNQKIIMLNYAFPSSFLTSYIKYNPTELYSLTGSKEGMKDILKSISQLYKSNSLITNIDFSNSLNLLINSYGNIRLISSDQLHQYITSERKIPFLEKLNILSSNDRLLMLNTYDNFLLYNSTQEQINYSDKIFRLFHSLYQIYGRFNLYFFVKIPKYPISNLDILKDNHIYFIKRIKSNTEICPNGIQFKIDNEKFYAIDLGLDDSIKEDEIKTIMQKQLIQKCHFHYYLNSGINNKQAIEGLNQYFRHEPYIAIFCNLKSREHKEGLSTIIQEITTNHSKLPDDTSIIVIDHDSNETIRIVQVFKDKFFDLHKTTLKNTQIESKGIEHYSPMILKKLFIDINSINNHQWRKDIDFKDNSLFVSH